MRYLYFGNFTTLRPETVLWRLRTLEEIISERFGSMNHRAQLGIPIDENTKALMDIFLKNLEVWLLVTGDDDKAKVEEVLSQKSSIWPVQVFTLKDIISALQAIG